MHAKWSSIGITTGVLLALLTGGAAAAPLSVPAVDGAGLMSVLPSSVTYGTSTTFTFTFTAVGDFGSGSQVQLTIPAGWTPPTTAAGAGHVSVSSGTCTLSGSPPFAVTPPDIFVDMASCTDGNSFSINYNGKPPGVLGSPFTFLAHSDIGPGGEGLVALTAGSPSVTVDPKALTVSGGLAPASRMYDGTTSTAVTAGSPTLSGVIGTDSVSLDATGAFGTFADKNVGTSKPVDIGGLTLTGAQSGNYTITPPVRSANITARPITITAVTDSKPYDGTTSSTGLPTLTSGAIQAGDTAPTWTQTFNTRNAGTLKTLTPAGLVNDGFGGANYSYTYAGVATGTITKLSITVTAVSSTKIYNGNTSSSGLPTLTSGAIQTGDTEPTWTQTYDNKNVGTNKTLTPAGVVSDGNAGNNYDYTYAPDATGVITPKNLTVSATGLTPANRVYDGDVHASLTIGSPTLVGVISPDVVTLSTGGAVGTFADKHAANGKTVYISGLTLGGAQAGNYSLTQPTRTANITKRPITVTAATDTKTYDGDTSSVGAPSLTSGGIQVGDIEPAWTQTFFSKHAGTGKTLTPAGSVLDGNGGNNYAYTFATNTTGVITPLLITVTALSDTKIYDGTTHSGDLPNHSALVGTDTPNFTQSFNTRNYGTGRTLTPAGVVNDGNSGLNYTYDFVTDNTGVITQKAITVSAGTDNKTYDGTIDSGVAPNITPGLGTGDTSGFTQTFDSKDAGTGKILTASGLVNDGNLGANYVVSFVTDTNGVILPKDITVTADEQSKAIGALDPDLTFVVNPALVSGDTFGGALNRDPGETAGLYAIVQDTLTAGSNYTLTYIGAHLLIGPAISGNTGAGGATLAWTDGSAKTATADSVGNYQLIVSSGWTGTVVPSKPSYQFTPTSRTYSAPVSSDLTGENYTPQLKVTSIGAQDGWLLESTETSGKAGSAGGTATQFYLGDDAANRQYRAILSFNTGPLPDSAVITSVTLKVKTTGTVGANPFGSLGNIVVDLKNGSWSGNAALQLTDFYAAGSKNYAMQITNAPVSNWFSTTLPSASFGYINLTGTTQFRLRFATDDNNNLAANYLKFASGEATTTSRPQLIITYHVP